MSAIKQLALKILERYLFLKRRQFIESIPQPLKQKLAKYNILHLIDVAPPIMKKIWPPENKFSPPFENNSSIPPIKLTKALLDTVGEVWHDNKTIYHPTLFSPIGFIDQETGEINLY